MPTDILIYDAERQPISRITGFERRPHKGAFIDWIELAPADAFTTTRTWSRIKDIRPAGPADTSFDQMGASEQAMRMQWEQIEPHYNAWLAGEEIPDDGTPIVSWPALNKSTISELKQIGVRTVEAVAGLSDSMIGKLSRVPNARQLPALARTFLEAMDATATVEREAEKDRRLAELEAKLEALTADNEPPDPAPKPATKPAKKPAVQNAA